MDTVIKMRWTQCLAGALAGLAVWGLIEIADRDVISDRGLIVLTALTGGFFGPLMAMIGPLRLARAAIGAAGIAGLAAGLTLIVSLRYADPADMLNAPLHVLALLAVVALPVPFLISAAGPGWRDYPALFEGSWSVAVRSAAGWVFTGAIWAVIVLSDQLLQIVGITAIGDLIDEAVVPFLITGGSFGLGLAVVTEHAALISPRLVLRLLRLLVPVVLAVTAVFVLAAPLRGLSGLFQDFSAALVLLTVAAAAISLVTITVDAEDAEAPASPVLRQSARGLAVLVGVLAGLAVWAIWQRVAQYGWTPERLFAALVAALALGYGAIYGLAVLRGAGWMARIRAGNLWLALASLAVAVLWLTPVLNAERISAQSQLARYLDGRTEVAALDVRALGNWGAAGQAAKDTLAAKAEAEGDVALHQALKGELQSLPTADLQAMRAEVAAALPVQPASSTGMRDALLSLMPEYELTEILDACKRVVSGRPGCVMVVADLVTSLPGEEAMLALDRGEWVSLEGIYPGDGVVMRRSVQNGLGQFPGDEARALLADWQAAPPAATRAPINQLGTGETGVFFLP